MGAPDGADPVEQRQLAAGVVGHIGHRKIIDDKGLDQNQERQYNKNTLAGGQRTGQCLPVRAFPVAADQGNSSQHQRQTEGQDQGKVAQLRDQGLTPACACTSMAAVPGLTAASLF